MKRGIIATRVVLMAAVALILINFTSCSKNNGQVGDTGEAYLTCKINGEQREFNYLVNANDKPATDTVHFVVIGGWEKQDMVTGFSINMQLAEGAKEATYIVNDDTDLLLAGKYYIQNMRDDKIVSTTIFNGGDVDGSSVTLTITSLTKWGVKGTFSGKLRRLAGEDLVTVTDGKFSAPYN